MTSFFSSSHHCTRAWLMWLLVAAGLAVSPGAAWAVMLGMQLLLALTERVPAHGTIHRPLRLPRATTPPRRTVVKACGVFCR